ncbi:MAG: NAD(+)/NADH kinase [Planctomycetes bacterium]|nr:NAD(+)/NADH kinase [Planctomycetota bacterium]
MAVTILVNPNSGKAKAQAVADQLMQGLVARGIESRTRSTFDTVDWESELRGTRALVVVGGDGTVNRMLDVCSRAGVPIYHYPAGNQNLFARACRHPRNVTAALGAIESNQRATLDLGAVARISQLPASRLFALMVSVGPDAAVIERLASIPRKGGGHWHYAKPVLAEAGDALRVPRATPLRVWVDGKKLADDAGWLVVAANPPYALGLDPCAPIHQAADGQLDIVFFPMRYRLAMLLWMARCMLGSALQHPAAVHGRGKAVVVEGEGPWQLDGEAGGRLVPGDRLRIECLDRPITYLKAN